MGNAQYTETEEKIFQAAIQIFARDGKKGARMQEIADRAGLNKALVHYYFRSKERLYNAVFDYITKKYFSTMFKLLADAPASPDMLRTFIDRYVDLIRDNPHLPPFVVRELSEGAPVLRGVIEAIMMDSENVSPRIWIDRIRAMQKEGMMRDVDPVQLIGTVIGACLIPFLNYPVLALFEPSIEKDRDQFLEERKKHIYDVLYNGIRK